MFQQRTASLQKQISSNSALGCLTRKVLSEAFFLVLRLSREFSKIVTQVKCLSLQFSILPYGIQNDELVHTPACPNARRGGGQTAAARLHSTPELHPLPDINVSRAAGSDSERSRVLLTEHDDSHARRDQHTAVHTNTVWSSRHHY